MSEDRERDEMHLRWLEDREAGVQTSTIAKRWGRKTAVVRATTNRILREYRETRQRAAK